MVKKSSLGRVLKTSIHRGALLPVLATVIQSFVGCAALIQPRPAPVIVPQIIAMAKEGMTAEDIIAKMKASRTVYRLKATQLAELERKGVPGKVIDYMQKTYLDAVRHDTRLQDWQSWTMDDDFWYGGIPYGWPDYP